jgi:hypothetical protein
MRVIEPFHAAAVDQAQLLAQHVDDAQVHHLGQGLQAQLLRSCDSAAPVKVSDTVLFGSLPLFTSRLTTPFTGRRPRSR